MLGIVYIVMNDGSIMGDIDIKATFIQIIFSYKM